MRKFYKIDFNAKTKYTYRKNYLKSTVMFYEHSLDSYYTDHLSSQLLKDISNVTPYDLCKDDAKK